MNYLKRFLKDDFYKNLKTEEEKYAFLEDLVKKIMSYSSHGYDHVMRVQRMALRLAEIEGADKKIVKYASLLHDIARPYQDETKGKVDHAEKGAEYVRFLLFALGFERKFVEAVAHCVETHRFRVQKPPKTLEAKILHDADKLDSIGAIGILRSAFFSCELGAKIHDPDAKTGKEYKGSKECTAYREFLVKLSKVKDRLYLDSAKRIAEGRHNLMVMFFDHLNREWEGEA